MLFDGNRHFGENVTSPSSVYSRTADSTETPMSIYLTISNIPQASKSSYSSLQEHPSNSGVNIYKLNKLHHNARTKTCIVETWTKQSVSITAVCTSRFASDWPAAWHRHTQSLHNTYSTRL